MSEPQSPRETTVEYDARLQRALRIAKVGAWHVDIVQRSLVWSSEVASLLGLSPDSQPGREQFAERIHPEDLQHIRELVERAVVTGSLFETDIRALWPDGSIHWLRMKGFAHTDAGAEHQYIEGVIEDIDERKQLDLALRESQRSLRKLISHLPGLVYRCRNDGAWTAEFVSEGVERLTGHPHTEFESKVRFYGDCVIPEDRDRLFATVQEALADHRSYEVTYRIRHANGELRCAWEQGSGVWSDDGELQFLEGLVLDITDRMRSEEQRLELQMRLEQAQKLEALGTLAGGVAHDFNNVLAAIKGNASLALGDVPETSPAALSIHQIQRSAERASGLVRQILAFSREEAGHRQKLHVEDIVNESLRLLRASLPKRIALRQEFSGDFPPVLADPAQLHQVVMNLCVNAVQAIGDQDGSITIDLAMEDLSASSASSVNAPAPGRYVRLTISDTGRGMAPATLSRIFEPFFTTQSREGAAGLGLSVVHGVVRAHGGGISVSSTEGSGTRFDIYLPIAALTVQPEASAPQNAQGSGEHILFVDDEEDLVFLARRFFERRGYVITAYSDPRYALADFKRRPHAFDFVVTDLSMPGMSGHDFAREVLRIRSDAPVVLASGYLREQDIEYARSIGIRDVIHKPASMEELACIIHESLARQRTVAASTRDPSPTSS